MQPENYQGKLQLVKPPFYSRADTDENEYLSKSVKKHHKVRSMEKEISGDI